jgi:hypothetical protein
MSEADSLPIVKLNRRWYQYSLRSLLLVMLLASLGMSWVATQREKARRQREAVEAILKLHGTVYYDYQLDAAGEPVQTASQRVPTWWRRLLGDDFFDRVVYVQVPSDAALEPVEQLPDLQTLELGCNYAITDAGLERLRCLSRLDFLHLRGTQVTTAGAAKLADMPQLRSLELGNPDMTDADLKYLTRLTQLQSLDLRSCTRLTDAAVQKLRQALPAYYIQPTPANGQGGDDPFGG